MKRKALELAKDALIERRTSLAHQMAECDEAYNTLSKMIDEENDKEKAAMLENQNRPGRL
jgi:hypothetical protein